VSIVLVTQFIGSRRYYQFMYYNKRRLVKDSFHVLDFSSSTNKVHDPCVRMEYFL